MNASLGGTARFRSGHERAKSGNEARAAMQAMQTDTEIRECHAAMLYKQREGTHTLSHSTLGLVLEGSWRILP